MKLKVIYRMSDISSTNASPIYWDNKFALNKLCLRSFVEAFKDVRPEVIMICDRCPDFYETFVKQYVPFPMTIEFTNSGVRENAVHQYDYVTDDDYYLFQECDYLYLPDTGKKMIEACDVFDYISPYDHPDKYKEGMIPKEHEIILLGNQHWRSTDSTTSTFMGRGDMVRKNLDLFKQWGWEDHKRWLDFGSKGFKLWTPIPSIATHMVEDYMAPSINWKSLWEEQVCFRTH
jgi:hypothetical protein